MNSACHTNTHSTHVVAMARSTSLSRAGDASWVTALSISSLHVSHEDKCLVFRLENRRTCKYADAAEDLKGTYSSMSELQLAAKAACSMRLGRLLSKVASTLCTPIFHSSSS